MFQPRYLNKEAFEELEKSEVILSFDDIAENVFTRLNVSLNSDIYINFLALRRIGQHYKDITNSSEIISISRHSVLALNCKSSLSVI